MASCDSLFDEAHALTLGWSVFTATPAARTIAPQTKTPISAVLCPSERTSMRITCAACLKCSGAKPNKLISIRASEHGIRSKRAHKQLFDA